MNRLNRWISRKLLRRDAPAALVLVLVLELLLMMQALLLSPVIVPLALFSNWRARRRQRLYDENLRRQGRLGSWEEVEPKLRAGEGTAILQYPAFQIWWTPEDVPQVAPAPLFGPLDPDVMKFDFVVLKTGQAGDWFHGRYLDLASGTAVHTNAQVSIVEFKARYAKVPFIFFCDREDFPPARPPEVQAPEPPSAA